MLIYKRLGILILFMGFSVLHLHAAMVTFLVIEEGLRPGAEADNYSSVWEGGLMSAFFDAGHIVSNSPVLRVETLSAAELPAEAGKDFRDAADGGADYFILAVLNFNTQERKNRPNSVIIKIFTTKTRQLIYERKYPAGTGINLQEEYIKAEEIAKTVAAQIRRS